MVAFSDNQKPFISDTDVSNLGIRAVLSQVQDYGQERVVTYGSTILSKPERQYYVTHCELPAVMNFLQQFAWKTFL